MSRQVHTAEVIFRSQESNDGPVEIVTFSRLMRAQRVLRRELDAEVLSPRGLTSNDFETLVHLSRAEGHRLRRIDLVELLMLTPSGVTRLLEGLEGAGLVASRHCPDDARVSWASLTDQGLLMLECVRVEHAALLRSLFCESLTEDEVVQLSELLGKLPGVGAGSCVG